MEVIILIVVILLVVFIGYYFTHKENIAYEQIMGANMKRQDSETNENELRADNQEDFSSEIAWRSDRYKRTFSSNDVVTFYETDQKTQEIWKGYMIVQSFAVIPPHKITLIPQITFSSKLNRLMNAKEAAQFHPELTPPDHYYDSTREEAIDFLDKMKETEDDMKKHEKIISQYIDSIKEGDCWIELTKSAEERFE